jgi:hypothetical protein
LGDVLVRAGSGYDVVEIACEVESWGELLRNTSIPVGIQTSRGLHRGWVVVNDHTNSAAIRCVGSKIEDETDWTVVRFDEISLEEKIISIVKPQVLKIWKENKQ